MLVTPLKMPAMFYECLVWKQLALTLVLDLQTDLFAQVICLFNSRDVEYIKG